MCPKVLFDKDRVTKRHIGIQADLSESPLFARVEWTNIISPISYTSVTSDPDSFANISSKNAAY